MLFQPIPHPSRSAFTCAIAEQIWDMKYRYKSKGVTYDTGIEDTWRRVARSLSAQEPEPERPVREAELFRAMDGFRLLPAGRVLAGAGTHRDVTLFNTFVMRTIPDSLEGICDTIKDAALTMKMGGGLGFDFSTIRPRGTLVNGLDCGAAGPIAAMDVCDSMCKMLVSNTGRGAMMACLRCDHPDIEAFIHAKTDPARLRNFNLSVMVSDAFMGALEADADWELVWDGEVVRRLKARALWEQIMERNYEAAEPGVLFCDRINERNPLRYAETITATNSCAEQPLPAFGACPLSSINLARLVIDPFGPNARLDRDELRRLVHTGVRMLDNTIDVSALPLGEQREEVESKRRIGLGVTGVADALIMLGEVYGSDAAAARLEDWMREIQNTAYRASVALARERGAFPAFDAEAHLASPTVQALDADVREGIAKYGLRNGLLTTLAPTGTTSLLAGNVSSGIEPVFSPSYHRKVTRADGTKAEEEVVDYALAVYRERFGAEAPLPENFVTAMTLGPLAHVKMQAAAQKWIDSAISKTVNCPEDIAFDDFEGVYLAAFEAGCKGCTTYRPNAITGSVLAA